MKLISQSPVTQQVVTGQKSDGSDRKVTTVTNYVLAVLDDDNIQRTLSFDHNPTAAEVYAAVTAATALTPTTKADWARAMKSDYELWQRWKNTLVEATSRGLPQPVITALTSQTNTAWNVYAADVVSWNSAS